MCGTRLADKDWKDTIEFLTKYVGIENASNDTSKYYTQEFIPK